MKATVISIVIAGAVIFGALIMVNKPSSPGGAIENVTVENGKQVITVNVRGGYSPQISNAKAGVPTTLRLVTNGTFDCSAAISIPALGYRANLPQSGTTEVNIPSQATGSSVAGTCAMGMYNFKLNFN